MKYYFWNIIYLVALSFALTLVIPFYITYGVCHWVRAFSEHMINKISENSLLDYIGNKVEMAKLGKLA
jgi:hypothetical protein